MIDWSHVRRLKEEVGPEDFEEMLPLFYSEIETAVRRVEASGSAEQLARDLHYLRSGALNLGFRRLSQLCAEGEKLADQGKSDAVDIPEIRACYLASRDAFAAGLSDLDAA